MFDGKKGHGLFTGIPPDIELSEEDMKSEQVDQSENPSFYAREPHSERKPENH
jgi:hypothetical protein